MEGDAALHARLRLRWELYTPITERARRTAGFLTANGTQEYVINPQPGYQTRLEWLAPRVQAAWQVTSKFTAHAGGGITDHPAKYLAG